MVAHSVGFHLDVFGGDQCDCLENKIVLVSWRNSYQYPDRGEGRSGFERKWYTFAVVGWQGKANRR